MSSPRKKMKLNQPGAYGNIGDFFGGIAPCPHLHFNMEIINREVLSRDQHLNLLATPKGYRWEEMSEKKEKEPSTQTNKSRTMCGGRRLKKGEKVYIQNFLAELWTLFTPDLEIRLKGVLMNEFGMSPMEAEEFIEEQRKINVKRSSSVGVNENKWYCPANLSPALYEKRVNARKPCQKIALGVRNYWIKEFTQNLANSMNAYIMTMLSIKRSKRTQCFSEVILKLICTIIGQDFTLDSPETNLQKLCVFVADRLGVLLGGITCTADAQLMEMLRKMEEKEKEAPPPEEEAKAEEVEEIEEEVLEEVEEEVLAEEEEEVELSEEEEGEATEEKETPEQVAREPEKEPSEITKAEPEPEPGRKEVPEEKVMEHVVSWIDVTKPEPTPRQEELDQIVKERLEQKVERKDETAKEAVAQVSKRVSTWVDKLVKDVEKEYGITRPATEIKVTPTFRIKRNYGAACYSIKEVPSDVVLQKVMEGRSDPAKAMTGAITKRPEKKPGKGKTMTDWVSWATDVASVAENWAGWIDKTCTELEESSNKHKQGTKMTKEEWTRIKKETANKAIEWRKNKQLLKEAAKMWEKKYKKS
uniref:Uncharacterized protein n=1 Tax=Rhodnius prolixus TaxID=13249 RepID=T1HKX2_RHOPR